MLLTSLCAAALALYDPTCINLTEIAATNAMQNPIANLASNLESNLPSPVSSKAVSSTPVSSTNSSTTDYLIGVGKADITGPAAETGMFGYAAQQVVNGINDRLYARAFIVAQSDQPHKKRIVYVSADMGAMFTAVKLEVIKRLQAEYGALYTDTNVMLTATHTHVGNAGYSHQRLYQIASKDDTAAGYSSQAFNAIVDGIVRAIKQAHEGLTPGKLTLAQGQLQGATRNRSLEAYHANPDADDYASTVNDTMTQLRFDAEDGTPLGLINWFAIHPTSFSKQFTHLSADNKGYAQLGLEVEMSKQIGKDFVAAFANADEGDVVAAGGNADSALGFEGSDNEWQNVIRDGSSQLNKSRDLWSQGKTVTGPIDIRARWINLAEYQVQAQFTAGDGVQPLCLPARGYSFAAGAENGPSNIPGIYEGMTRDSLRLTDRINKKDTSLLGTATRSAFGVVSSVSQDDCQAEKPVLLPTGFWGWVNNEQPVQLMRIGNLGLIAIPGEPTTMVGRRIRNAVDKELADIGVDTLVVAGLANNYSGYVATREEYALQHYEGASTSFGPYQANALQQEYTYLAQAMRAGRNVASEVSIPDRSNKHFAERPGVVYDDKPQNQRWGQVLQQPKPTYKPGDTVSVEFRGAHPKNNLRTEDSFLIVQRLHQDQGQWLDYKSDKDFDTSYSWQREKVAYSRVTINWRIGENTEAGTYRIVHKGDWKNGWDNTITPYTGVSNPFQVQ